MSSLRADAAPFTPVGGDHLVFTIQLGTSCGASIVASDYSAPSSPRSSVSGSAADDNDLETYLRGSSSGHNSSNTTGDFIKLFPANAFPLLGAEPQQPQQPQPLLQAAAKPQAKPQARPQAQQRRRSGPRPASNTLWQHVEQALPKKPTQPKQPKQPMQPKHSLAVGMAVRMVDRPNQTGNVLKCEGERRVHVAFSASTSHGAPIYRWLNVEQVEQAPVEARRSFEKCPHPPQSLEAKLWYKKRERVQ